MVVSKLCGKLAVVSLSLALAACGGGGSSKSGNGGQSSSSSQVSSSMTSVVSSSVVSSSVSSSSAISSVIVSSSVASSVVSSSLSSSTGEVEISSSAPAVSSSLAVSSSSAAISSSSAVMSSSLASSESSSSLSSSVVSSESSSSQSSSAPRLHQYQVQVGLPELAEPLVSFSLFAKAHAAMAFEFALVDIDASGRILKLYGPADYEVHWLDSYTYRITSLIAPRFDRVLVAGFLENLEYLKVGDSVFGGEYVFSPLASTELRVDEVSAATYQSLVSGLPDGFDSIDTDTVAVLEGFAQLVEGVRADSDRPQESTIAAVIESLQQALNIKTAAFVESVNATDADALSKLAAEGLNLVNWSGDELLIRQFDSTGVLRTYLGWEQVGRGEFELFDYFDDVYPVLTETGWVTTNEVIAVDLASIKGDSLVLTWNDIPGVTLQQTYAMDLTGMSLDDAIKLLPGLVNVGDLFIESVDEAILTAEDKFIAVSAYATEDQYEIWFSADEDDRGTCKHNSNYTLEEMGGNCSFVSYMTPIENFPEYMNYVAPVTNLDELINSVESEELATKFAVIAWSEENDRVMLVAAINSNNTVHYFVVDDSHNGELSDNGGTVPPSFYHVGGRPWAFITKGDTRIIELEIPAEAQHWNFEVDDSLILTEQAGFVRGGTKIAAGTFMGREMFVASPSLLEKIRQYLAPDMEIID